MLILGKEDGEGKRKYKKRRKKKKNKRGEENLREFSRFSSGSDGSENLEEVSDHDDLMDVDDDEMLFSRSDHEFSCESDVPDDQAVQIKHARTAKKKRGRKPKGESAEAASSEEDDGFACKACNKVSASVINYSKSKQTQNYILDKK